MDRLWEETIKELDCPETRDALNTLGETLDNGSL